MEGYKYYSTQRPVDLLTYPDPPDNPPVEIKIMTVIFVFPYRGKPSGPGAN